MFVSDRVEIKYSPVNAEKATVDASNRFPVRKLPCVSGKKTLYAEVHMKKKAQGEQQTADTK